jgi:hypothetical protein
MTTRGSSAPHPSPLTSKKERPIVDDASFTLDDYRAARATGRLSRPMDEAYHALALALVDHLQMVDALVEDYASPPRLCILFARQASGPLLEVAPGLDDLARIERVLAVLELWDAADDEGFAAMCARGSAHLLLIAEDVVAAARGTLTGLPLAWLRATADPLLTPALLAGAPRLTSLE